jgi:hypothetical protein
MTTCGVFTGILFTRKPCDQPAAVHCGRCRLPLCKQHIVPQASGPFLCPSCDRYEQDDNWQYSSDTGRWRFRSSSGSRSRDDHVVPAAAATGAVLSSEDKESFATESTDSESDPDSDTDPDTDTDDGDFDAS